MADYTQYKTETLKKMCETAYAEYYRAAVRPCGNWSKGCPEAKALERATKRYEAICAELERRAQENKCASCAHNIGVDVVDCEYAFAGVEETLDEGRIVVLCGNYKER